MKVIQTYYECSMSKAEEYYKILTAKEIGIMKERMKIKEILRLKKPNPGKVKSLPKDLPPTVLCPSIHVQGIGGGLENVKKSDIVYSVY